MDQWASKFKPVRRIGLSANSSSARAIILSDLILCRTWSRVLEDVLAAKLVE